MTCTRKDVQDVCIFLTRTSCHIYECYLAEDATRWVKVQTHSCAPFDDYPEEGHRLYLHACDGFQVVFVQVGVVVPSDESHDNYAKGWLYGLCTSKWRDLLRLPGKHEDIGPSD